MDWHTKTVIKNAFALLVSAGLTILFLAMLISDISMGLSSGTVVFIIISLFMFLVTYSSYRQLVDAIEERKNTKNSTLLSELRSKNKYGSTDEMMAAYYLQKSTNLYKDDKIIITTDFVARQDDSEVFIIDGILDAVSFVQKTNGIISYVSLIFLYYDGNRYEIKYRRPLGLSNMQEIANNVNFAANIIANTSENYRKYSSYILPRN